MFKNKPFWVRIVDTEGDTVYYTQCTKAKFYTIGRVLQLIDDRPFLKGQEVVEIPSGYRIVADKGKIKVIV